LTNDPPFSDGRTATVDRPPGDAAPREGLVLRVDAGQYIVHADPDKNNSPQRVACTLRGNLRKTLTYSTSASQPRRVMKAKRQNYTDVVAVGDRVRFTPIESNSGVIEEVYPRETQFARSAFRGREQTLVTNLDQLVIVFACAEPNPDLWRLDRWLISAEFSGLSALIVANKRDRVDAATVSERFDEFRQIGYRVIETSAKAGIGIDALRSELHGRISAFTGPSGVGKSSLLNALQPGLKLATGDVGEVTFKGRHTTTVRELIPLESGGWVADTPGLRQLDLLSMTREDLLNAFVEFVPLLETPCRFRNCRHDNEPDCVLKTAAAAGKISARRYESFLALAAQTRG
jgi:ribosome biogenesis GTPase / thiamine phosphate phosphatase